MPKLTYTKCHPEHLGFVRVQEEQAQERAILLSPEYADAVRSNFGITGWVGSRCMGAAGLMLLWPGRAIAWAVLSADLGPYMLQATRKVKSVLDTYPVKRIETTVRYDFEDGHRWAKALGLTVEAERMVAYNPDGTDATMYVRIK